METTRTRLGELIRVFLKIGATGFGGPAALIAMMEDEIVTQRQWVTREKYLDLIGVTNLIPGPNATEIALHIGHLRAGLVGLIVSGVCFILPAALITTLFAWLYVRFGALPQATPFLYGLKPVVLAIILSALWRLGKTAIKGWALLAIGLFVIGLVVLGLNEVIAMFTGGLVGMLWLRFRAARPNSAQNTGLLRSLALPLAAPAALKGLAAIAGAPTLWRLGLFFLKIGAVLYGSGYVLFAFLEGGLVQDYGWLTQQQLIDAIAVGQFTPGPVSSAATFIGYLLLGTPGAAVATVAMFLPSFLFVLALTRVTPHVRRSPWSAAFLDAINVSALALMAIVTVTLGRAALVDWPAALLAIAAVFLTLRYRVNSTWLVLGGAILGWVVSLFRG